METSELKAYTTVPSYYENSTYLSHTKNVAIPAEPMSGSTMGILMVLSALQYQAPYMPSQYSNAASQAGRAAFIQSGAQSFQDKLGAHAEAKAKEVIQSAGITDTEVGVVLGTAKVMHDKQIDVNGPHIYFIKTHVNVGTDHGSLGLKVDF